MAKVESEPTIYRRELGSPPTPNEIKEWDVARGPESINVDATENCNLWCPHCGYPGQQERREEGKRAGEKLESPYIETAALIQAYDEIIKTWNPAPGIQFTANGEPLLHPDREKLITYPAERGLKVGLTTNGIILTPDLVERFCQAGVSMINVSVDAATSETYAKVRPTRLRRTNHFKRVVENVRRAVEVRNASKANTKIMINMIERPESAHEKEAFTKLGLELGVDNISIRPLNTTAGLTPFGHKGPEVTATKNGVITQVDGQDRWPCHFPFKRMNMGVGHNGSIRITYCPHSWDQEGFDIGFYPKDGSLGELWRTQMWEEIRKAHLSQTIKPDSPCAKCIDWFLVTRTGQGQATYKEIMTGEKKPTSQTPPVEDILKIDSQ